MVIAMNGGFFVTFEIFLMQQWFLAMCAHCAVILVIVIDGGFTCECAFELVQSVKVTRTPEINEKCISTVNVYLASTDALGNLF